METTIHDLRRLPTLIAFLIATLALAILGCQTTGQAPRPAQVQTFEHGTPYQSTIWQSQQAAEMWHRLDIGQPPQPKPSDVPQPVWDGITRTANQITKDGQ